MLVFDLRVIPLFHKVAARDLGHHCTQMRMEGRLFISCLPSFSQLSYKEWARYMT